MRIRPTVPTVITRALGPAMIVGLLGGVAACGGGSSGGEGDVVLSDAGARGHAIAKSNGCAGCHGTDGQGGVGPSWVGLYGSDVELQDGSTVVADDDYLARAIADPGADIVEGASVQMPSNRLSDDEIADVVAYIRDLFDRLMIGRSLRLSLVAIGAVLLLAPTDALADPAGPTDYRTEVVSIEPESPNIDVEILGGDAFVQVTADAGTDVVVMGYGGEPYLWIRPDGAVLENQNSAATLMNTSRNGAMPMDAGTVNTDAEAAPDWKQIGTDHRWAWHDHRAHWMQAGRPIGASPGDQILEGVIPIEVDGTPVAVTVASRWEPAPSPVPMWIGGLLGLLFAAGAFLCRRRGLPTTPWLVPPALLALVAGLWQYLSLPAATGPLMVWWMLPAIAVTCALGGVLAEFGRSRFWADAAMLVVGIELAVWGWIKRDGLSAALIPTAAPGWLDRLAVASSLTAGVAFAALALWFLFGTGRRRTTDREFVELVSASRAAKGSPRPAHP